MSRYILIIVFGTLIFSAKGQLIYKCYIKKDCHDVPVLFKDYMLHKDNKVYLPNEKMVCVLPDTGTYHFTQPVNPQAFILSTLEIKITNSYKVDTFQTDDVYRILLTSKSTYSDWQYCGGLADGFIVDTTIWGRKEGYFKKGKAIGVIKTFNLEGKLVYEEEYNKHGKLVRKQRFPDFGLAEEH